MNDENGRAEVWVPIAELRWSSYRSSKTLQQKWVETMSGKTEWRDVPVHNQEKDR